MDTNNKLREVVIAKMQNGEYELKPCPFCGEKPVLYRKEDFDELDEKNGRACISVDCPKCSLNFYDHTSDEHDYYVRAFYVVEKWNRRAE